MFDISNAALIFSDFRWLTMYFYQYLHKHSSHYRIDVIDLHKFFNNN